MILGAREPRISTPPLRELTAATSLGFEAIDMWRTVFGRDLMPFQEEALIRGLELAPGSSTGDEFPRLRFKTLIILIARQNGKTYLMTARALWRMLMWRGPGEPAPTILGLAHKLGPTEEILEAAIQLLAEGDVTRPLIAQRSNVNGNKFVRLASGAKWLAQASNDDAGRSMSVTDLLFDELRQQRDWQAWSAAENTTNSIFSSQVLGVSNAGEAKSVVLAGLRKNAIDVAEDLRGWISVHGSAEGWSGDSTIGILEWSAPDGADVDDVEALAQANPAMNRTVNGRVLLTEQDLLSKAAMVKAGSLPEHKFRTENMCQWVTAAMEPTFPPADVEACTDLESVAEAGSPLVYAVDVSQDRRTSWVAAAGWRPDGRVHVEVIAKRSGTHWISDFLSELAVPGPVVVQGRGAPASSLITWLQQAGHDVRRCEGTEVTNSLSQMDDALREGTVRFRPQGALLLAMKETVRRQAGEVALLDRYNSQVDAAPLCAVVFARWGLTNLDVRPARSAYDDGYDDGWYVEKQNDKDGALSGASGGDDWRWWA